MKKLTFIIALLAFISCEKKPIVEQPKPLPTVFEFVYSGKHHYEDFTIHVGPKGEKIASNDKLASSFWGKNSLLGNPSAERIIIDTQKGNISFKYTHSSPNSTPMKIEKDTVKNDWNKWEYFGILSPDKSIFTMNRAFYFINYKARNSDDNAFYGYHRYWKKATLNDVFSPDRAFGSLTDMTLKSDTIACLTDYYIYKLDKSY